MTHTKHRTRLGAALLTFVQLALTAGAALAQATAGAPAAGGAPGGAGPPGALAFFAQVGPILLVFVILYFLMIRPQQQKQQQLSKMQSALKKGDRVLTQAGIYGTIVGVDGDKAVLRVDDNVKLEFQRSTIIGVVGEKS